MFQLLVQEFQENSEPHILHNLLGAEAEEGKVIMGVGISGGVRSVSHTPDDDY